MLQKQLDAANATCARLRHDLDVSRSHERELHTIAKALQEKEEERDGKLAAIQHYNTMLEGQVSHQQRDLQDAVLWLDAAKLDKDKSEIARKEAAREAHELKQTVVALKEEVMAMQSYQGENSTAAAACKRLEAQVKALSESRDHTLRAHAAIEKESRDARREVAALRSSLSARDGELAAARAEVGVYQDEAKGLIERLHDTSTKYSRRKEEVRALQGQVEALQKEVARLQGVISDASDPATNASCQALEAATQAKCSLESQLSEAQARGEAQQAYSEQMQGVVAALQKRLREHGISAADLPRVNVNPSTIAVQRGRISELETAVATFQEEARLAVEKFTDTHTRLVALQSELAVVQGRNQVLSTQLAEERDRLSAQLVYKTKQLEEMRAVLDMAGIDTFKRQLDVEEAQKRLELELDTTRDRLQLAESQKEAMQQALVKVTQELSAARSQVGVDRKDTAAREAELQAQIIGLQARAEEAEAQVVSLQEYYAAAMDEVRALSEAVSEGQGKEEGAAALQRALDAAEAHKGALQAQLAERDEQMAALSRPRERIAELERQLWSMHEAAQALHAGGAQKEAEAQALRDKIAELDAENNELSGRREMGRQEIERLQGILRLYNVPF